MLLYFGIAFILVGLIGGMLLQIKHNTLGIFTSLSSKWSKKDYILSICVDGVLGIGTIISLIYLILYKQ